MNKDRWRPLKTSRGGIKVSHFFFLDDLMLFVEANKEQVDCILEGLRDFCEASGQLINLK